MAQAEKNMAETAEVTAGSNASLPGLPPRGMQIGEQDLPSAEEAVKEAESIVNRSANIPPDQAQVIEGKYSIIPDEERTQAGGGTNDNGGENGDNGNGGGGPEGPRVPEPNNNPEWLASPERGRLLVEKILYMETKLPYEVRYNAENGPVLNELYAKLKTFVERFQEDRYKEPAFDLAKEHQVDQKENEGLLEAIQRTYDEWLQNGVKGREEARPPEDLSALVPLRELIAKFDYANSPDLSDEDSARVETEYPNVVAELLKYFKEADRRGLLVGVNMILDSIYENIISGKRETEEVRALADQQTVPSAQNEKPAAYISGEYSYMSRRLVDPDVVRLRNVWDPYLKFARMRLENEFRQDDWTPREGEWRPISWESGEEETTETFWSPYGGYPNYYLVTARTPAQFRRAMESFIEIIRNGSLGYSPSDLMNHIQNFQQVYSSQASRMAEQAKIRADREQRPLGPDDMTVEIGIEDRQELQGRTYLWYSFYQYEHYNKEEGKNGATAMALNEGPARHTAVLRSGEEGEVGSGAWDYDYLPEYELALNAQGSRGQLGDYTPAQEYLRDTIFEMQTEKRMGVVLKDYDRRDVVLAVNIRDRANRAKRLEEDEKYLRRHRGDLNSLSEDEQKYYLHHKDHAYKNKHRIGIHQSPEEMRGLYEGFDYGDAHRRVYQEFKELSSEKLKLKPKKILKSFRLGMVQTMMDKVRTEVRNGGMITDKNGQKVKAVLRKGDKLLNITVDALVGEKQIEEKEKGLYKRVYESAYARAKAGFEVVRQLEGVSHESTTRGGGVYFIYRNRGVVNYVREYINYRQEQQKKVKAADPDNVKEISKWSLKQRNENFNRNQHLGWIIDEMAKGRRLDTFPPEEQALYNSLNLDERETFVDNVPIHQAQEYGMAAVNWTMMHYADDAPIWQEERFKIRDAHGRTVSVFEAKDDNDQYLYPNFRAIYRTAVLNDTLDKITSEFAEKGFSAKLRYLDYDFDLSSFNSQKGEITLTSTGEPKVMTFKRPHIFGYTQLGQPIIAFDNDGKPILGYDQDGKPIGLSEGDFDQLGQAIIYDKPADIVWTGQVIEQRKNVNIKTNSSIFYSNAYTIKERSDQKDKPHSFVFVEEVELDFQTAVESYLALHTTHTYWAYQSNNTHTLIPEYVLNQARQIRDGLLRPEDADIFAGLLLTLDPTLTRIKSFSGDKMTIEGILFDAVVEQSLMGSVYVKNKLNEKTMPRDGNAEFMGAGYFTEDLGGDMGFSMEPVARAAKMPRRWARRFSAVLNSTPIFVDSMARNVGRRGVIGATTMMADNIKDLTHQPIMSQFALTKFINMIDSSAALWFALVGGTDPKTGVHHEGLFMKPTNEADKLTQTKEKIPEIMQLPNAQNEGFYAMLSTFGRLWDTLKVIRTMYSDNRNAGGALLLEKMDVILPDGRINPAINLEEQRNTGTSRHIAKMFYDTFIDWLLDEGPGGGAAAYPDVAHIYAILKKPVLEDRIVQAGEEYLNEKGERARAKDRHTTLVTTYRTWADWLFAKMVL